LDRQIVGNAKNKAISIGQSYRMTSDGMQWVVEHLKAGINQKTKQPTQSWHLVGYYPKINDACESLLEHKLTNTEAGEIKSLIWLLAEAKREILEAIKTLNGES